MKYAFDSILKRLFNVDDFTILEQRLLELGICNFKVYLRIMAGSLYKNILKSENLIIMSIFNNLYFCDSNIYKEWKNNLFAL